MTLIDETKAYLEKAQKFGTKEAALQAAVKRARENENALDMVMRQKDGKFLVCGYQHWEDAIRACGCEPVYACGYIYDLAAGRNPTEEQNQEEIAVKMGRDRPGGVKKAATYAQLRGGK